MSAPPSPPESVATIATRVVHDLRLLAVALNADGNFGAARLVATVAQPLIDRICERALDTTGGM